MLTPIYYDVNTYGFVFPFDSTFQINQAGNYSYSKVLYILLKGSSEILDAFSRPRRVLENKTFHISRLIKIHR